MLSDELYEIFNNFNVSSNNKNDEIHKIFKCFNASSNDRNDNYVER